MEQDRSTDIKPNSVNASAPTATEVTAISQVCERLSDCENRIYETKGLLNVMHKAVAFDEQETSDDNSHGYPALLQVVRDALQEMAQEMESLQCKLSKCVNSRPLSRPLGTVSGIRSSAR